MQFPASYTSQQLHLLLLDHLLYRQNFHHLMHRQRLNQQFAPHNHIFLTHRYHSRHFRDIWSQCRSLRLRLLGKAASEVNMGSKVAPLTRPLIAQPVDPFRTFSQAQCVRLGLRHLPHLLTQPVAWRVPLKFARMV